MSGNLVEWFSFYIYSFLALYSSSAYWYVTFMAALTFVVAWKMPDPQKSGLLK